MLSYVHFNVGECFLLSLMWKLKFMLQLCILDHVFFFFFHFQFTSWVVIGLGSACFADY